MSGRRRRGGLVASAACIAAIAVATSPAATTVTTIVGEVFVGPGNVRMIAFSGVAADRRAGRHVTLQARQCGSGNGWRAVDGARTLAGGSWSVRTVADNGTYFRARIGRRFSRTLTFRSPLKLSSGIGDAGRVVVTVNTWDTRQNMAGRELRLERRTDAGWMVIRTARFARWTGRGVAPSMFVAILVVEERGLRLRVVVPAASAAPCYAETVSAEMVS